MNPKFSSLLFTELVLRLSDTKIHDEILQELIDRLVFCKFDYKTITAFIELEKIIIKNSKLNWDDCLYNKYWWFDSNNELIKNKIFIKNFNEYFMCINKEFYGKNIISKNLLSVSELICLMDEATYIDIYYKNKINDEIKKEIDLFKSVSNFNNGQIVAKEIFFRFMSAFEVGNGNSNFPKEMEKSATYFYENEKNILFLCKWTFKHKLQYTQKKVWKSYSNEYFLKN